MKTRQLGGYAILFSLVLAGGSVACGGSDGANVDSDAGGGDGDVDGIAPPPKDSGSDATLKDGGGDSGKGDGASGDAGPCFLKGSSCTQASDCCTKTCTNGVCGQPACTSDNQACTTNAACCGGSCVNNACAPLNPSCKTLGNTCATSADCCSQLCQGGLCAVASFCGQNGDVCGAPADCCGGVCNISGGNSVGVCGQPPTGAANCTQVDGTVCGGAGADAGADAGFTTNDGGLPSCGGACCSRLCAPYGPTGVPICQPASGCHVVGDLCRSDTDCCGSLGSVGSNPNNPVTCNITAPNLVGVCRNPQGCKPDGDICKLSTMSCNASCDCCSGNCQNLDTCKQDSLGVPRCAGATCVGPGLACASSANCCNGLPCVPNPNPDGGLGSFVCGATACVPTNGLCTVNADCCSGETCHIPQGGTSGTCVAPVTPDAGAPDGGVSDAAKDGPCALYGQLCTTSADCCNGTPCSGGRCVQIF